MEKLFQIPKIIRMRRIRVVVLSLLIIMIVSGCGTLTTVFQADAVTKRKLNQVETRCEAVPRVYSGVAYDFCILRGKPSQTALWLVPIPELMMVDIALSAAFDTVLLPYTIYEQIQRGSIYIP